MPEWPRETTTDLVAFYGTPDADADGFEDKAWVRDNLVRIAPPWPMVAAWDPKLPITKLTVHWRVAESLQRILAAIFVAYGGQPDRIIADRLHLYGGGFNFRMKRNGNGLSTHSYGAAIDLDPERNGMGVPWKKGTGMMAVAAIDAFKAEGWTWGGDWKKTPDAMHFQAVK